jgi:NTP pyrophosphatase (non-canonical NTP hydrolase)
MWLDTYQKAAMAYRMSSANKQYAFLNLAAEAGEVMSLEAKRIRDLTHDSDGFKASLAKELGDVMWMVAAIATDHNLYMSDICQANLQKLEDRKSRQVIGGSGDNR